MAIFKEILASKIEKDIRSQNKEGSWDSCRTNENNYS
jgi:hypothetical protein